MKGGIASHHSFRSVACAGAGTVVSLAVAGPPLITDDPETLPKGRFELNTAYTLTVSDSESGRTWYQEIPLFDLNYGLVDGVQLKSEVPLVVLDPAEQSTRAGVGDLSLGSKLRLLDEKATGVGLSVYPALSVPLGSSSRGLGTGSCAFTLPAQIGKHFFQDRLFIYADGGYDRQYATDETDHWFLGVAAEYEIKERFILCAEVHSDFGLQGGANDTLFNLGVKYGLAEHATFIGSAGRSFDPQPDRGNDLQMYVGVQWSF
ncbi:MAG: transporter [Phycisphaeraceae bacterium]|nr:transporter [Phycisphaeraceae bacterium]